MQQSSGIARAPRPSGLYDVVELILDKGLVIDAYVRVSLVGIELLTIDARIVIASVDTYLRFAEAVNRLDLNQATNSQTLPQVLGEVTEKGAEGKSKGALSGAAEAFSDAFSRGRGGNQSDESDESDGSDGSGRRERQQTRTRRRRDES
jgi:hypothetical protein